MQIRQREESLRMRKKRMRTQERRKMMKRYK
jgi:hypothetical protein